MPVRSGPPAAWPGTLLRCRLESLSDLKGELASLRIDRDRPAAPRLWRWPLFLFIPIVLVLAVLYGLRARQALSAPEVETVRAAVVRTGGLPRARRS